MSVRCNNQIFFNGSDTFDYPDAPIKFHTKYNHISNYEAIDQCHFIKYGVSLLTSS